ncbi:hypothetical protein JMJ55_21260 [Belnapia sp. T6]|uniref:Uncharacterized protein n=1 Tax=Belnapia mucosa TaxID=2804532 RepID=A0ABS1V887_9PROT|nr:hypothetical protein [Belnapia mucosa]MBL6457870.1 hypothetical protein [Belnapia mucosa]
MPHSIRVAEAPNGALTYAIPVPPQSLPPVAPRQLLAAWELAREAADRQQWGKPRLLLFPPAEGSPSELAIADRDAGAWAEAIDAAIGLDTMAGLSLCLRLLALVELLGRARWLTALFAVTPSGIDLHPALLGAAAAMPLDAGARFDESGLRRLLSRRLPRAEPAGGGISGLGRTA